jgi:hypothetical protein
MGAKNFCNSSDLKITSEKQRHHPKQVATPSRIVV